VDVEEDVLHDVLGRRDLAGQDACSAGLGVMLAALRGWELVAAVRAAHVACGDDALALWALLGWSLAVASAAVPLGANLIDWPVSQNVSAEVED
jgi:hypothetical protein